MTSNSVHKSVVLKNKSQQRGLFLAFENDKPPRNAGKKGLTGNSGTRKEEESLVGVLRHLPPTFQVVIGYVTLP